jgi:hypothetical protein
MTGPTLSTSDINTGLLIVPIIRTYELIKTGDSVFVLTYIAGFQPG